MATWKANLIIEDKLVRENRYGKRYCVLYTNSDLSICCDVETAKNILCFHPYEMSGRINVRPGGVFLSLRDYRPFGSAEYGEAPTT